MCLSLFICVCSVRCLHVVSFVVFASGVFHVVPVKLFVIVFVVVFALFVLFVCAFLSCCSYGVVVMRWLFVELCVLSLLF